jgi:Terminase-like family.
MPARSRSSAYADRAAASSLGLLADATILQRLRRRANSTFDVQAAEARIIEDLLPYQRNFATDFEHKYVGFCGGYGCVAGETLINGTPIKELTTQPIQVQTLAGPSWATPAYKKGVAPLYRVTTEAGHEIVVTEQHKFLTPSGWKELDEIDADYLIAVREEREEPPSDRPSPWTVFFRDNWGKIDSCDRSASFASELQYGWSAIKSVEYVRDDDFYDLHVPFWNHYEAHGIIHHNSGKTYTLVVKQVLLCFRSQGFTHLFLEPTIPLIDDVALPTWNLILEKYGIPHTFKVSPRPVFKLLLPGGETPILLRSMENYERLIGVNAASIASDETDTTRQEIAEKAMIRLQGRVRVGNCPQIVAASTPEGYGFMYTFFEEQKADNKKLYRGKSEDNPHLDKGFVEDLKTKYHPQLVKAYLNGEFVNLESATVFFEFDRTKHSTGVFLPEPQERIVFGADFNVGQCHALYGVVRAGQRGQELHCFAESKVADTFALVSYLQQKYPRHLAAGLITCYPDASGSHDSTSSTQSDHELLRGAGVRVVAERKNPYIAETLAHANVHMHRNLVFLNPTTCHDTVNAAERWSYDSKTLKPSKGGATDYSHPGDALRYLIWQVFPRAGSKAGHGGRWR